MQLFVAVFSTAQPWFFSFLPQLTRLEWGFTLNSGEENLLFRLRVRFKHLRNGSLVDRNAGGGLATAIYLERRRASRGQRVQYLRSGFAVHAPGFMPGVLTTLSRDMVTIPRVELGGIALAT